MPTTLYPYRITLAMPTAPLAAGATNTELAAWLNAQVPSMVPADLGPPLSRTGLNPDTHRWASASAQDANVLDVLARLAGLVGLASPSPGIWAGWTGPQRLAWANETLHPALYGLAGGGVLLEEAAAAEGTDASRLTVKMGLVSAGSSLPTHPSKNLVWRLRADTGVYTDLGRTPISADGDLVRFCEDLGPFLQHTTPPSDAQRPAWKTNRINGRPSLLSDGVNSTLVAGWENGQDLYGDGVLHGIGTGAFSVYAVVRFTTVGSAPAFRTIWQNGSSGGSSPALFLFGTPAKVQLYYATGYFFGTTIAAATWYYLLLTRRASDNLIRLWVNGTIDGTTHTLTFSIPDNAQQLMSNSLSGSDNMRGEIAELGLYKECVETSGQKATLDSYIAAHFGL